MIKASFFKVYCNKYPVNTSAMNFLDVNNSLDNKCEEMLTAARLILAVIGHHKTILMYTCKQSQISIDNFIINRSVGLQSMETSMVNRKSTNFCFNSIPFKILLSCSF